MSEAKKLKKNSVKSPDSPSWKPSGPSDAPDSKSKSMPSATARADVSKGDGDGKKMEVSAEVAKTAPSSKGSKQPQGEKMELPKGDAEDRHY